MGNLPCKLGCPLLPYMETVDSSVSSPLLLNMKKWATQWAAEWDAHGNFAMQMRLPTTMELVGSSVGSPLFPIMEIVGSSVDSPLKCPLLNLKCRPSLIHMQDICSTCVFIIITEYVSSQISNHTTNRMNTILNIVYIVT